MNPTQDWDVVILRKKKQNLEQNKIISQQGPNYQKQLNDNPEEFNVKMFDNNYIKTVINNRISKKMTQKQLAQAINEDVSIINRFEQGKEVYNHQLKNKLNRVLGLVFK